MLLRLCQIQHAAIRRMHRTLDQQQQVNEVLSRRLEQALRDAELLLLMVRDKDAAVGFVRDQHDIASLEEPA